MGCEVFDGKQLWNEISEKTLAISEKMSNTKVCPPYTGSFSVTELGAVFPNGIATISITPDPTTRKLPVSAVSAHILSLQQSGIIPNFPIINPGTGELDVNAQSAADVAFLQLVQSEYCFYESRYTGALSTFFTDATSLDVEKVRTAQSVYLPIADSLNLRLNSIFQILEVLNSNRVTNLTNSLQPKIQQLNATISTTSRQIQEQYALLSSNDAVVETQKQMIVYTKEKNEHVMNQIALFTIMNAFAIGGIFAIWRMSK